MKSIKDIAIHYGVSDRTVRNWLKAARKDLGKRGIGSYEGSKLYFTEDEVKKLRSYGGDQRPEPVTEVLYPELEPENAIVKSSDVTDVQPLFAFNIQQINVTVPNADTSELDTQADRLHSITAKAAQGISQFMQADMAAQIQTAMAQNRYAVMGAQAQAATQALKDMGAQQ